MPDHITQSPQILNQDFDIPVVILAGGQGTRMGNIDKCLLKIQGETILQGLIKILRLQSKTLLLNANGDPARFADYDITIVADEMSKNENAQEDGQGPLAGVLAAMNYLRQQNSQAPFLLSVAGDSPFLPENLMANLLAVCDADTDVVYCHSAGRDQFVIALWSTRLAPRIAQFLSSGRRSVGRFIEQSRHRKCIFDDLGYDRFININTPEQLEQAQDIARDYCNEKSETK